MSRTAKFSLAFAGLAVILLSLAVLAFKPFSASAAEDAAVELDISQGNITITSTGYVIGESEEVPYTGEYIITQSDSQTPTTNNITVSGEGVRVTIQNLNISGGCPISIESGSCTLILKGTSTLTAASRNPAVKVSSGNSITIDGSGYLKAVGGDYAAGIGGSGSYRDSSAGNITINGGEIEAEGGNYGAGIGDGQNDMMFDEGGTGNGSITITGGKVTASSRYSGTGIGGSYNSMPSRESSSSKEVIISGGTVTATGGTYCAGIGGDWNVTISGGKINAQGGESGAGIGGNSSDGGKVITIKGGEIEAKGGNKAAGIGGGRTNNTDPNITIENGTITAIGGEGAAGIGGGSGPVTIGAVYSVGKVGCGGNITINGGTITAQGGSGGAGIGGGDARTTNGDLISGAFGSGGTISINGGNIKATGGDGAAGIGGGNGEISGGNTVNGSRGDGGDITITGGTVEAQGGTNAAGIGGGSGVISGGNTINASSGNGGDIDISGGNVTATGGSGAAGIGGGNASSYKDVSSEHGDGGSIDISGGNVTAAGGNGGSGIGGGQNGSGGDITVEAGEVKAQGGNNGAGIDGSSGGSVTVNGGTVEAQGGDNAAGIDGSDNGSITITDGEVTARGGSNSAGIDGNGGNITIDGGIIEATGGEGSTDGIEGAVGGTGGVINGENSGDSAFTAAADQKEYTYGDEIIITGTAYPANGLTAAAIAAYFGDESVGEFVYNGSSDNSYAFTIDTKEIGAGERQTITIKLTLSNETTVSKTVTVNIKKADLNAEMFEFITPENLIYDGTAKEAGVKTDSDGIGEIAFKYYKDGSEAEPVNAGDYTVSITVSEGINYNAVTEELTSVEWKFTIEKAELTADMFDFSYNSETQTASVSLKEEYADKGVGEITSVKYNGSEDKPADEGKYTVSITVSEGTNYNAAVELTSAEWSFTIGSEDTEPGNPETTAPSEEPGETTTSGGSETTVPGEETTTATGSSTADAPNVPQTVTSVTASAARKTPPLAPVVTAAANSSEQLLASIVETEDGGTLTIDLKGRTSVDRNILEEIAGRDINVTFKLSSGAYWTINGKEIERARKVDLGVRMNSKAVSRDKLKELAGDSKTVQFALRHNGEFGFKGILNVPVNKKYNGKHANLYYYNKGDFEFMGSSLISGGYAKFAFTHASDYIIVISDEPYGDDVSSAAGIYENSESENLSSKPYAGFAAIVPAGAVLAFILRKRSRAGK